MKEIKIDRSTLPEDQQKVKFRTHRDAELEGIFVAEEDIFLVNSSNWYSAWEVYEWEPIQ